MEKIETNEDRIEVEGTFQCIITKAESVLRQLESNTRSVPTHSPVQRSSTFVSPPIVSLVPSFFADQSLAHPPAASSSLESPAPPPAASSSLESLAPPPAASSSLAAPLVICSPPNPSKRFDKSLPTSVSPVTATPAAQNSVSASVTTSESPHESCVMNSDASVSSSTPLESKSSSIVSQAVTLASLSVSQPESHPSCVMSCIPRTSGHQSSVESSNDSHTATLASAAVTDTHSALPMQRSIVNTASVNASSNITAHRDENAPHPPSMAASNAFAAPLRVPVIPVSSVVVPTCTSTVSSICTSLPTLESASAALPETSVSAAATETLSVPPIPVRSANDAAHDASSIVISCCNDPPTSTTVSASTATVSISSSAFSTLSFLPVSTQAMSASVVSFKAHHVPRSVVSAILTHSYTPVVASNTSSVPVSARNAPTTAPNAPATANCAPVLTLHAPPVTELAVRVLTPPAPVPVASVTSHPTLPVLESAFVSDVPNIISTSPPAPVPALTSVLAVQQEPPKPTAALVTIFAPRTLVSCANTAPVDHVSNVIVSSNELALHSPTPATAVAFPAPSRTCISSANWSVVSTVATTASSTISVPVPPLQAAPAPLAASASHNASCSIDSTASAQSHALPAPVIVFASVDSLSASVFTPEIALSAPVSVRPGPVAAAPASAFVLQQAAPFSAQVSVNAPFVALVPVSATQTVAQFVPAVALESAASISNASRNQIASYPFAAAVAVASAAPPNSPFILHAYKQSQLHCTTLPALQSA
ncbi:mucin-5AC-like [Planococcus citri]|uniref:mucin-5AC-like n=1 Tax=Planococcus citri TaxID=170843 RepID=UPI0031F9DCE1